MNRRSWSCKDQGNKLPSEEQGWHQCPGNELGRLKKEAQRQPELCAQERKFRGRQWPDKRQGFVIRAPQCSQLALLATVKTWKQPKCPSADEWIKKMWYIYTMEYYLVIKRNEIGSFVETWMDLETVIQSEVSQKEKDKYRILTYICGT